MRPLQVKYVACNFYNLIDKNLKKIGTERNLVQLL